MLLFSLEILSIFRYYRSNRINVYYNILLIKYNISNNNIKYEIYTPYCLSNDFIQRSDDVSHVQRRTDGSDDEGT